MDDTLERRLLGTENVEITNYNANENDLARAVRDRNEKAEIYLRTQCMLKYFCFNS